MTLQPPVSVVLCTYNGGLFIAEQVKSILSQTYPVAELVIVDDASTDNTVAIINDLAHPVIRLYQNETNIGFTANFEKALLMAQNDLIAISDQDDIWHEKKIEILIQQLTADCLMIYCDSVRFNNCIPKTPQPNKKNRRIEGNDPKKIAVFNTISGHAMIIKRQLLVYALPFPPSVYYDWWLALTAACNGGISFVPDILVFQRVHDQNVTIQPNITNADRAKAYRAMLDKHLAVFRRVKGLNGEQKRFFETLYRLWHRSLSYKINWRLFMLLMRHRHDIYFYKVRKFGFISQLKHSFLFSFRR